MASGRDHSYFFKELREAQARAYDKGYADALRDVQDEESEE